MIKPLVASLIASTWLLPSLPPNHDYSPHECPVAGNVDSGIYHVPGSRDYRKLLTGGKARLFSVACFDSEAEALGAGYRKTRR